MALNRRGMQELSNAYMSEREKRMYESKYVARGFNPIFSNNFPCTNNGILNSIMKLKDDDITEFKRIIDGNQNLVDENGYTPLIFCTILNKKPFVEYLLDTYYPKLDVKNVLITACRKNHFHIVEILLKYPIIDVNEKDEEGNTPLSCLIKAPYEPAFEKLLLRCDLNLNYRDATGKNLIEIFIIMNMKNLVMHVLNHPNFNPIEFQINETFINCLQNPNFTEVLYGILKPFIQINYRDQYQKTILHHACQINNSKPVEKLLKDPEVDVNAQDNCGMTPLMLAILADDPDTCKKLLNSSKCQDPLNNQGQNALLLAVIVNNLEIFSLLVQNKNFNVNVVDTHGDNALIYAIKNQRQQVVEQLLQRDDIDINVQNLEGFTPLMTLLLTMESKSNALLQNEFILFDYKKIFSQLVNNPKLNINITNNYGQSVLLLMLSKFIGNYGSQVSDQIGTEGTLFANSGNNGFLNRKQDYDKRTPTEFYYINEIVKHKDTGMNLSDLNDNYPLKMICRNYNYGLLNMFINDPRTDLNQIDSQGDTILLWLIKRLNGDKETTLTTESQPSNKSSMQSFTLPGCDFRYNSHGSASIQGIGTQTFVPAPFSPIIENTLDYKDSNFDNEYKFLSYALTKLLGNKNVNVNHSNYFGENCLNISIVKGSSSKFLAQLFNHKEIDIENHDLEGNTPLLIACREGKWNHVIELIKRGANVNHKNTSGETIHTLSTHKSIINNIINKQPTKKSGWLY